ncbi:MAG: adenylosuccinate synthetase, partial [Chloroflexota bacterium]
ILDERVLRDKLELVLPLKNRMLQDVYGEDPMSLESILSDLLAQQETFGSLIVDQVVLVAAALDANQRILLEGQLGALRDLDWGTYPFVTSSTTLAGGGGVGGGIPARFIDQVVGVVKAYTTAVGSGPLPTELHDESGECLRSRGKEFGATTGRPRRVGWFDAVAAHYACRLNGFTEVALTKLDVLDGLSSLPVCTAYLVDGERLTSVPTTPLLARALPEYEVMPGWKESTSGATTWNELPGAAKRYVQRIQELVGAPIGIVSVGQDRNQTLYSAAA